MTKLANKLKSCTFFICRGVPNFCFTACILSVYLHAISVYNIYFFGSTQASLWAHGKINHEMLTSNYSLQCSCEFSYTNCWNKTHMTSFRFEWFLFLFCCWVLFFFSIFFLPQACCYSLSSSSAFSPWCYGTPLI